MLNFPQMIQLFMLPCLTFEFLLMNLTLPELFEVLPKIIGIIHLLDPRKHKLVSRSGIGSTVLFVCRQEKIFFMNQKCLKPQQRKSSQNWPKIYNNCISIIFFHELLVLYSRFSPCQLTKLLLKSHYHLHKF